MTQITRINAPKSPLPPPLRGAEIGSFAHQTITTRIPNIARRTLAENDFPPDVIKRLTQLIAEIPNGRIRPLTDSDEWNGYTAVYEGQDWLTPPWFFVETYFYRRIMEALDYFGSGPTAGVDPFAYQKQHGLETTMPRTRELAAQLNGWRGGWNAETFARLLAIDLWGNQADMSMWSAATGEQPNHADQLIQQTHTLADDTTAVTDYLTNRLQDNPTTRLDFIIDNAGFELAADLALADYLLSLNDQITVRFHLKIHPTFVSDALIKDVKATNAFFYQDKDENVRALGERLTAYATSGGSKRNGRLQLHTHPYWTSPLPGWEMPDDLRAELAAADLVISKGDANYRRLLGDRHWPYTTPFTAVVSYFPAPLVALRTLKANLVVGLTAKHIPILKQKDPDWLVNGRWGLIQSVLGK
ncbi:MAG: protein-glutamate O-methyltransferase family protein [Chloroflexi bacterium]|nr:protein-glutamate O-methyltransferase family protein [Chloroflexota bacterium]